jgi:hypothetical protein
MSLKGAPIPRHPGRGSLIGARSGILGHIETRLSLTLWIALLNARSGHIPIRPFRGTYPALVRLKKDLDTSTRVKAACADDLAVRRVFQPAATAEDSCGGAGRRSAGRRGSLKFGALCLHLLEDRNIRGPRLSTAQRILICRASLGRVHR